MLLGVINVLRLHHGDSGRIWLSVLLVVVSLLQTLQIEEDCLVQILDLALIRRSSLDRVNMVRADTATV